MRGKQLPAGEDADLFDRRNASAQLAALQRPFVQRLRLLR
jgi:hypothetical protein